MKKLTSKLTCLFILAFCLQVLSSSTGITASEMKQQPTKTKQIKSKKLTKNKAQMPLFKSLLNHF